MASSAVLAETGSFRLYRREYVHYLMNMLYSDFAGVLGDNADIYMKMACAYIDDPDADEGKVFRIWKSRYVS